LVELTVPFETGFKDAAERKEASYEDLVYRAKQAGYDSPHCEERDRLSSMC